MKTSTPVDIATLSEDDGAVRTSTGFAAYLAAVKRLPRQLPPGEEQALARRMHATDGADAYDARVAIFESLLWWASRLAGSYVTARASHEDLVQVANLALWRALPNYSLARRVRVISYVTPAITRDLRLASVQMSALVKRPQWLLLAERRLDRLLAAYLAETGHAPGAEVIAAALDLPLDVAETVRTSAARRPEVVSLDELAEREAARTRPQGHSRRRERQEVEYDVAQREESPSDPSEVYEAREAREETVLAMRRAVAHAGLTSRQMQLVGLVYGHECNLSQAAARMQISPQRASQLHAAALKRIRAAHERMQQGQDGHKEG